MRTSRPTRLVPLAAVAALAGSLLAAPLLAPAPASADDDRLVIVGPADLADSGLAQALTTAYEEFHGAPIEVDYVSGDDAESVARASDPEGGVGVLLLANPELESRFVADGHSAEPAGRAAFWSDVLVVGTSYPPVYGPFPKDLVHTLETVAAAGAEGKGQLLSRGGTNDETVREHALWALTDGVPTCTVSEADGGGESPSTVAGPCPSPIPYPSWYVVTGTSQVETLEAADACVGFVSPSCLAVTSRGTVGDLRKSGRIDRLFAQGEDEYFAHDDLTLDVYHAYAVAGTQDVTGPALDFVDWLTGPAAQDLVKGRGAYRPAAATQVSSLRLNPDIPLGEEATTCGRLSNPAPRSAAIGAVPVTLHRVEDRYPRPPSIVEVATTTTHEGAFCFDFSPRRTYDYLLTVPEITSVQHAALGYRDTLRPRTLGVDPVDLGKVVVRSLLDDVTVRRGRTTFHVGARFVPVPRGASVVAIYAGPEGAEPYELERVARFAVRPGTRRLDHSVRLGAGRWQVQLRYHWGGGGLGTAVHDRTIVLR